MFSNNADPRFQPFAWKMSTRTDGNNACVAVQVLPNVIGVCDSKAGDQGPVLAFTPPQWTAFTTTIMKGRLTV